MKYKLNLKSKRRKQCQRYPRPRPGPPRLGPRFWSPSSRGCRGRPGPESLGGPASRGPHAGLSPWSPVERTLTFGCRQAPLELNRAQCPRGTVRPGSWQGSPRWVDLYRLISHPQLPDSLLCFLTRAPSVSPWSSLEFVRGRRGGGRGG